MALSPKLIRGMLGMTTQRKVNFIPHKSPKFARPERKVFMNALAGPPPNEWPENTFISSFDDLLFQKKRMKTDRNVSRTNAIAVSGPPTGDWPASISLNIYEDLEHYFNKKLLKKEIDATKSVSTVMSKLVHWAKADDKLSTLSESLEMVSGVPVLDSRMNCIGVLSRRDVKGVNGDTVVKDVMSSPPICMNKKQTIGDAAALMLKYDVHRIPVTERSNGSGKIIGMVTRTDIFTALGFKAE